MLQEVEVAMALANDFGVRILAPAGEQLLREFLQQQRNHTNNGNTRSASALAQQFISLPLAQHSLEAAAQYSVIQPPAIANIGNNNNGDTHEVQRLPLPLLVEILDIVDVGKSMSARVQQKIVGFERNEEKTDDNNVVLPPEDYGGEDWISNKAFPMLLVTDGKNRFRIASPYSGWLQFISIEGTAARRDALSAQLVYGARIVLKHKVIPVPDAVQNNNNNNNDNHNNRRDFEVRRGVLSLQPDNKTQRQQAVALDFLPITAAIAVRSAVVQRMQERRVRGFDKHLQGRRFWRLERPPQQQHGGAPPQRVPPQQAQPQVKVPPAPPNARATAAALAQQQQQFPVKVAPVAPNITRFNAAPAAAAPQIRQRQQQEQEQDDREDDPFPAVPARPLTSRLGMQGAAAAPAAGGFTLASGLAAIQQSALKQNGAPKPKTDNSNGASTLPTVLVPATQTQQLMQESMAMSMMTSHQQHQNGINSFSSSSWGTSDGRKPQQQQQQQQPHLLKQCSVTGQLIATRSSTRDAEGGEDDARNNRHDDPQRVIELSDDEDEEEPDNIFRSKQTKLLSENHDAQKSKTVSPTPSTQFVPPQQQQQEENKNPSSLTSKATALHSPQRQQQEQQTHQGNREIPNRSGIPVFVNRRTVLGRVLHATSGLTVIMMSDTECAHARAQAKPGAPKPRNYRLSLKVLLELAPPEEGHLQQPTLQHKKQVQQQLEVDMGDVLTFNEFTKILPALGDQEMLITCLNSFYEASHHHAMGGGGGGGGGGGVQELDEDVVSVLADIVMSVEAEYGERGLMLFDVADRIDPLHVPSLGGLASSTPLPIATVCAVRARDGNRLR